MKMDDKKIDEIYHHPLKTIKLLQELRLLMKEIYVQFVKHMENLGDQKKSLEDFHGKFKECMKALEKDAISYRQEILDGIREDDEKSTKA